MRKWIAAICAAAILTVYILFYIAVSGAPASSVFNGRDGKEARKNTAAADTRYRKQEAALLNFVEKNLVREDGAIVTNTKSPEGRKETLAESVGLLMDYALIRDRADLFEKEYLYLKNNLLTGECLVRWKSGPAEANCNAVIDDLRIARALLDGYDKWGRRQYNDTAGFIQDGIYSRLVEDDMLFQLYDWKAGIRSSSMPLCYIDLYTIDRLGRFNKHWADVFEHGVGVINGGRIDKSLYCFNKYFDQSRGVYLKDEEYAANGGVCLTYTLYTVMHLAEVNYDTSFFTKWLDDETRKGKLYAWYEPLSMKPASELESTAVYALAAIYADLAGEDELYCRLVDRMLKFMVTDKKSTWYGGFGNKETGEFYSFDNLTALWALAVHGS